MKSITLHDESLSGEMLNEIIIQVENERISIKDLIKARVYQEVEKHNELLPECFNGLVQPQEAERVLNGYRMKTRRAIDPERQTYIAWDAFQANAFFILVDEYQAEGLEDEVLVSEDTKVSFVKLSPLVGG